MTSSPSRAPFPQALLAETLLASQVARESNARTYPRRLPVVMDTAEGLYVRDVSGRVLMDCLCGAGTLALGHNHPVQVAAIRDHLTAGRPMHTLDLTSPTKDAFVTALMATLPKQLRDNGRIHFCSPSGSDAVEAALKLAKTATGRRGIVSFSGGYHGHTQGALSLMGNRGPKHAVAGATADVQFLPYPFCYRCPLGRNGGCDAPCGCEAYARNLLHDPESGLAPVAAMVMEPVQGEGGVIPAPPAWLRAMGELANNTGTLLIMDEVQTGWGRTGKMYGFEHGPVVPDILVLSKAIGGGLPLAVIVYRGELDLWQPGAHTGTFRGNLLAMASGLATLGYLRDHDVPANAAAMGERFTEHFAALQRRHRFIGEVRGRGLMLGIEIVDPDQLDAAGRPLGDSERSRAIQAACFKSGLMIELGGRNGAVVRLLPPLIITPEQVDVIAAMIGEVCDTLAGA